MVRGLPVLLALSQVLLSQVLPSQVKIPAVWDDAEMERLELPLAGGVAVRHIPSEYYYRIPVRPVLKSYPIYGPGREPAGYWEWLQTREPEAAADFSKLRTDDEWISAGEHVFRAALAFLPVDDPFTDVRNPRWYSENQVPLDAQGVMPFYRYVIREKGKVEVAFDSCAECHSRIMPDGSVVMGAQGNIPFARLLAWRLEKDKEYDPAAPARAITKLFYGAPWHNPDPTEPISGGTMAGFVAQMKTIPPGVLPRQGTSMLFPSQTPDLIGLKNRHYLDHTGLQQHRSIADLMRYDAINNFIEEMTDYGGFRPGTPDAKLPEPKQLSRYGDEHLYALAMYVYSLQPPPNPNRPNALSERGQKVFRREGCGGCHPAPLYTNNSLTPADGFDVPEQHRKQYRILDVRVGTEPTLAMKTRRGTGYYKVPSLKGVWYRGPFEHNGSVATLEDWFDPARLRDDYIPTGYKGPGGGPRAVKGHEYGLTLSPEDKAALIAFLKTL